MSPRLASRLVGGAGALAGVCSALLYVLGQPRWGAALLGLAVAALAAGTYVVGAGVRGMQARVSGQAQTLRKTRRQVEEVSRQVGALDSRIESRFLALERTAAETLEVWKELASGQAEQTKGGRLLREDLERIDRVSRQTRSGVKLLQSELPELPYHVAELQRLYGRLVSGTRPMPPLGGWALTTPTLLELVHDVLHDERRTTIVECGSGTSTVWMALALEARGGEGSVVALEHDARFGEQTRRRLAEHGVSHRARVIDTGLAQTTLDGHVDQPWYDLSGAELPEKIDVLFVDGPVGSLADAVRYPAYPLLAGRLAEDALVVLDDTNRAEERQIVDRWIAAPVAGRQLEEVRSTDRATIMRVR